MTHCILIGAPVDSGQQQPGCLMGPAAYRVARLAERLAELGHTVEDMGDITPDRPGSEAAPNLAVRSLPETLAWTSQAWRWFFVARLATMFGWRPTRHAPTLSTTRAGVRRSSRRTDIFES